MRATIARRDGQPPSATLPPRPVPIRWTIPPACVAGSLEGLRRLRSSKACQDFLRLAQGRGPRPNQNPSTQATAAAEFRIVRKRHTLAPPATQPGLETARAIRPAVQWLRSPPLPRWLPIPIRQPPPPPAPQDPRWMCHQARDVQTAHSIEARQARVQPTATRDPRCFAVGRMQGRRSSNPPRGQAADRPAGFPSRHRWTALATRLRTTPPGRPLQRRTWTSMTVATRQRGEAARSRRMDGFNVQMMAHPLH